MEAPCTGTRGSYLSLLINLGTLSLFQRWGGQLQGG